MIINKEEFIQKFNEYLTITSGKDFEDTTDMERYLALSKIVRNYSMKNLKKTRKSVMEHGTKSVYYFSMEFLIGRLLRSNLMNLEIYDEVNEILGDMEVDLKKLEEIEADAGLGNGGLGRLAACFLDSIASTDYSGHGFTIRYRNGFFKQEFESGYQVEKADDWLRYQYPWEVARTSHFDVSFYGKVESYEKNGKVCYRTVNDYLVRAIPYDIPVVGANSEVTNKLRMFDAIVTDTIPPGINYKSYEFEVGDITSQLYPDDSTDYGKTLRLKQQYFFVSAGLNTAIRYHLNKFDNLDEFAKYSVLQINDTHPAILVAEFMRVLIDEYDYDWDKAWEIVTNSCAYTNHTILAEALEKWPVEIFKPLLPRIYMIIEEINRKFCASLFEKGYDLDKIAQMAIISHNKIHMAHLAIVGSFSVNGVARLHTEILTEYEMHDWDVLYPGKFNNKTNGITHRRWFEYSNRELASLVKKYIGDDYLKSPIEGFKKLENYVDDETLQNEFAAVKLEKKRQLAEHILKVEGIEIDPNSIFDVQIKRLHAYKRQLLNALHIAYLYTRLRDEEDFRNNYHPHTFIFGAKAAPSYHFAKEVIKFINTLSEIINNDPVVSKYLKVVFVTNYNASYAEKIIPATDISEQISTAGFEASGTGNMKFMMNGAVTIGTMDGANVEIYELAGEENIEIFGMSKDEVRNLSNSNFYSARDIRNSNSYLDRIFKRMEAANYDVESIHQNEFNEILIDIFEKNDPYYILKDFAGYVTAHENLNKKYTDKKTWNRMCLMNIATSGFFSSDRTIEDYVRDIWKLQKISM